MTDAEGLGEIRWGHPQPLDFIIPGRVNKGTCTGELTGLDVDDSFGSPVPLAHHLSHFYVNLFWLRTGTESCWIACPVALLQLQSQLL